jgi:hypothetical protein
MEGVEVGDPEQNWCVTRLQIRRWVVQCVCHLSGYSVLFLCIWRWWCVRIWCYCRSLPREWRLIWDLGYWTWWVLGGCKLSCACGQWGYHLRSENNPRFCAVLGCRIFVWLLDVVSKFPRTGIRLELPWLDLQFVCSSCSGRKSSFGLVWFPRGIIFLVLWDGVNHTGSRLAPSNLCTPLL